MSIIGSNVLAGAAGGAGAADYQIQRSLRFNGSDSAFLSKTPASAGNRKTWTWSAWVKRSKFGGLQTMFGSPITQSYCIIAFNSTNTLSIENYSAGNITTSAVFRDPSAWYHVIAVVDTTSAVSSDRMIIYVNGVRQDAGTYTAPTQNADLYLNQALEHRIARFGYSGYNNYFYGYLADVHFIDGQALAPTNFGKFDDNNVWQPKAFTGTYGTNGFQLDFSDNSSNAALGYDAAGSNDWTVNNLSVASGTGNDSLVDSPTNGDQTDTGAGGEVVGNYCTWNPLNKGGTVILSNGNLDFQSGATYRSAFSTIGVTSGKWYIEATAGTFRNDFLIGISSDADGSTYVGGTSVSYGYEAAVGAKFNNTDYISTGYSSYTTGDIVSVAFDADNGKVFFAKNGVWQESGNPATGANPAYSGLTAGPYFFGCSAGSNGTFTGVNFGQRPFAYTAPSGYKALCTTNLPDPTIADGSTAMDVALYTGDGTSDRAITGLSMSPDFVWIKSRSVARSHIFLDAVRGTDKILVSDSTLNESDIDSTWLATYGNLDSFDSAGFTVTDGTNSAGNFNSNNVTYAAWTWDAGANSSKTYAVTVVSDSGNKYRFDGFGTSAVTLDLEEGSTYTFDQSDSSNSGHPLRFSTTSNGTHGGGSEYTTGVVTNGTPGSAGAYTRITVAAGAPTLYYYCSVHSGMGGQVNTNSTAGASNFDGSIISRVRANPAAGFSIVSVTADASDHGSTVGHGLNAKPEMIIEKRRDASSNWYVHHSGLGDMSGSYLRLNARNAKATDSTWNISEPTSSVISVDPGYLHSNTNADVIYYLFAPVDGYSAMGSYTGNGSTDGPFVYTGTGLRPRWVMIKRINSTGDWILYDTVRSDYNAISKKLYPNQSFAENGNIGDTDAKNLLDHLSNGFKLRHTSSNSNASGSTYIYLAFAENPFKTARAR